MAVDWLAFVASLIASLAWPLAIIFVVLVFRGELRGLLARLQRAKAPGFEASFLPEVPSSKATAPVPLHLSEPVDALTTSADATGGSGIRAEQAGSTAHTSTSVTSVGALPRGQVSRTAGTIMVALGYALDPGGARVRVALDTAGVAFVGSPTLTAPRGLVHGVQFECAGTALVVDLIGPTATRTQLTIGNLALMVAPDAPLGPIEVSVSVGGSAPQKLASIGTVVPAGQPA